MSRSRLAGCLRMEGFLFACTPTWVRASFCQGARSTTSVVVMGLGARVPKLPHPVRLPRHLVPDVRRPVFFL
ncbi:MAG: hypothetical protein AVDCRST_MAG71-1003, partial [uncultured Lysobacter sp.]